MLLLLFGTSAFSIASFSFMDSVCFFSGSIADSWKLVTFHLNCKYYPWGLINDMQLSIYNRKHWHALSHSLHFVRHEGRLATHPPSPASKSGSRLPIFNSVCLGLVPVQIDSPYLVIMSLITIPRNDYYTSHGSCRLPRHGRYSEAILHLLEMI